MNPRSTLARLSVGSHLVLAVVVLLATASFSSAQSIEGSFERTLKVSGAVDLTVQTGSGRIHVFPGPGDTVRVTGRIRASNSWFSGDASARIKEIEKNPPIEQTGNSIRLGRFADESLSRNISISYEVAVPAQTRVQARTGSGSVDIGDLAGTVDARTGSGGITIGRSGGAVTANTGSGSVTVAGGTGLTAHTGSGSIRASGISGTVTADSGSGTIRIALTGKGDVDVSSSSGGVEVTGVNGVAKVSASSGTILVEGRPAGPWDVHSSSGGITLRIPSDASFDLDAHVSSGRIETTHPITVSGTIARQRLAGKVGGGGPLVTVRTSSGGIRIQ